MPLPAANSMPRLFKSAGLNVSGCMFMLRCGPSKIWDTASYLELGYCFAVIGWYRL